MEVNLFIFGLVYGMFSASTCSDPPPLVMPGHVTIGVLADLRNSGSEHPPSKGSCDGAIAPWALQEVAALEWVILTINNQTTNPFNIGLKIYDNCGDKDRLIRQTAALKQENALENAPLLGIIALGKASRYETIVPYAHAFQVPILTTHLSPAGAASPSDNVFTTAPRLYSQMKAVISTLLAQKVSYPEKSGGRLGVISGCYSCMVAFKRLMRQSKYRIDSELAIDVKKDQRQLAEKTLHFIKSEMGIGGIVITLLDSETTASLVSQMYGELVENSKTIFIFSIVDGMTHEEQLNTPKLIQFFPKSWIVDPNIGYLPGLKEHLKTSLTSNRSLVTPLQGLLQAKHCPPEMQFDISLCDPNQDSKSAKFLTGTRATAAIKAVSSLASAFRLAQIEKCPRGNICQDVISPEIHKKVMDELHKLSFIPEKQSNGFQYTVDGRLISIFKISRINLGRLEQSGKFNDRGIDWEAGLPKQIAEEMADEGTEGSELSDVWDQGNPSSDKNNLKTETKNFIRDMRMTYEEYTYWTWGWTLFGLIASCVGMFATICIGGYIAFKYWDGSIRGSKFLGMGLLLGIFLLYASCLAYVFPSTPITCRLRVWFPNVAFVLSYSFLLTKIMHMGALQTVGVGGKVSQMNLMISLSFMVAIMVVITTVGGSQNGLVFPNSNEVIEADTNGLKICRTDKLTSFLNHLYILLLVVMNSIFGFFNRDIPKNHNESYWLWMASGNSAPIILSWSLTNYFSSEAYEVAQMITVCNVVATLLLVVVFGPKLKVITRNKDQFSHKSLLNEPTLSTVFSSAKCPKHHVQPPDAFCDSFTSDGYNPNDVYGEPGDEPQKYLFNLSSQIEWRDHMQESPCFRKNCKLPPPPPPPYAKIRFF